ncbi:hypothetical protein BJ138DRAFT_1167841 [Hygrophoropsis aurantiaca]|uniref:Uncharacterized protein n=1 Tax=Hygrophoropsis aurantiaca TaxID=72124 RepID=A0ACB7ZRS0_9AGAM|nr:hypothetical protein BJ138DRAFT_1167841 [Hygrophoropsis aurantiaca]
MRYMPKHIAESESGRALLGRAWNWVRGRHRFTASLVDQLLGSSFQSPHRTLSAYVEMFCNFRPTDGQPFVDEERADVVLLPSSKLSLDFSQILNDPGRLSLFSEVLYVWLIQREHLPLTENKEKLVQYGFARFPDGKGKYALVDEPLVLLAAVQQFRTVSTFSFEEYITNRLLHEEGRGQYFEQFVGLYLASAFDDGRNLCDVFDFGESVPEWARQGAEIVSVVRDGEKTSVHRFHLPGRMGATSVIGRKCADVESTLEWFENPSTLMCFPDVQMGPDVGLFARLDCGLILAIVVQIRWRRERILSKPVQLHAVSTVDPSKFYMHQNLKDKKYGNARERILESFRSLNDLSPDIETNGWFKDGLPVLRVITSYPAAVREDQLGQCVSLDMDRCLTVFDKDHVLKAVALSLGIAAGPKRGAEDDSIDTRPKKRSLPMAFP